jgi:hypothetical protein
MNRELGILRRILRISVAQGWLLRNPFSCGDAIIQPSADGIRERILTIEEEQKLLDACSDLAVLT